MCLRVYILYTAWRCKCFFEDAGEALGAATRTGRIEFRFNLSAGETWDKTKVHKFDNTLLKALPVEDGKDSHIKQGSNDHSAPFFLKLWKTSKVLWDLNPDGTSHTSRACWRRQTQSQRDSVHQPTRWWQFSRCENSDAQRSVRASVGLRSQATAPATPHVPAGAGRHSRSATVSTIQWVGGSSRAARTLTP
jgi:hypothetical protein